VVADYAELGVHRLAVMRPEFRYRVVTAAEFEEFVLANAPREVGASVGRGSRRVGAGTDPELIRC
jgi:hypothetical protein